MFIKILYSREEPNRRQKVIALFYQKIEAVSKGQPL